MLSFPFGNKINFLDFKFNKFEDELIGKLQTEVSIVVVTFF